MSPLFLVIMLVKKVPLLHRILSQTGNPKIALIYGLKLTCKVSVNYLLAVNTFGYTVYVKVVLKTFKGAVEDSSDSPDLPATSR